MEENKTLESIKEAIEKQEQSFRYRLDSFFNLLFWKNYGEGLVKAEDKTAILSEIEKATRIDYYDETEQSSLDAKKILPFINKLRKQLGLEELFTFADGIYLKKDLPNKHPVHMCYNHNYGTGFCTVCGNKIKVTDLSIEQEKQLRLKNERIKMGEEHLNYLNVLKNNSTVMQPEIRSALDYAITITADFIEKLNEIKIDEVNKS